MSVVINGSAGVTTNSGAVYNGITSGTAVASTSGTSIDFTSIPSWVKRITVMFSGVSLSSTASFLIQGGVSGAAVNTGYASASTGTTGAAGNTISSTSGFVWRSAVATGSISGHMVLTLMGSNQWVSSHASTFDASTACNFGGGTKTFAGTLDMVRITSTSTDTFDAGSINILYE